MCSAHAQAGPGRQAGSGLEHVRGTGDRRQCNGSGTDAGSQGTGGNKAGVGWRKEMNIMNMRPPPLLFIKRLEQLKGPWKYKGRRMPNFSYTWFHLQNQQKN